MKEGLIKFKINETVYTVTNNISPEVTLNSYVRDYTHAKGTKYMCQEGGCGACIVVIKRINYVTKKEEILAVNSCLIPVFLCHGWSIITVEGIGNHRNGFHKVQSTLARFSGTQCGYCSPGMVMNMLSLLNSQENVTMSDVENSFGGNICRCTGYRPILDAFKSLASDASPELKKTCVDIEDMLEELKLCPATKEICSLKCSQKQISCCDSALELHNDSFSLKFSNNVEWIKVRKIAEIFDIFEKLNEKTSYMLISGSTSHGVYRMKEMPNKIIDVNDVKELHTYTVNSENVIIGANTTLTAAIDIFTKIAKEKSDKFAYLKQLADHISLIANVPVRNVGTLVGNLSIKLDHPEFVSDLFVILEAVDALLVIQKLNGSVDWYALQSYIQLGMRQRLMTGIVLPIYDSSYVFSSYKIMQRAQNTHAYVNAGFLFSVDKNDEFRVLHKPRIVYGGIRSDFIHAEKTEEYLYHKKLLDIETVKQACTLLQSEIQPDNDPVDSSPTYRANLAINLFYKFILSLSPDSISSTYRSGGSILERPISSGKQDLDIEKSMWPVGKPIPKLEAFLQCSGEAEYVNDMPILANQLYASFVVSKTGPCKLKNIDTSAIKGIPGVVKFLSAKDIPGKNSFVELFKIDNEELFASKFIRYAGQPVGVVIAQNQMIANKAAELVVINVIEQKKPVINLKKVVDSDDQDRITKEAEKQASKKKDDIKYKFSGSFLIGSQYHFTLETQTCFCVPTEDGIDVYPSSQWLNCVQVNVSAALAIPLNCVNVRTKRCGGGFGSKLGRSALVATACAVAADNCKVPVMMVMQLETNMEAVGKRFPIYAKYEGAVNDEGLIQDLDIKTYTEKGAAGNDDTAGEIIRYSSNLYDSDTWKYLCYAVRTDIAPNTFARAPGSTEGVAMIEVIMEHIAQLTRQDPVSVRLNNLNEKHRSAITTMLQDVKQNSDFETRKSAVEVFNKENRWKKRGLTLVMMNYPYNMMFSYHILISVYAFDGTVSISHGGIEIGQGINTKVAQAAAYILGINMSLIKIKQTSSLTSPNDGATGGSMASDGVTLAAIECCKILLKRLEPIKEKNKGIMWKDLIRKANEENIDLCAEYMYSPTSAPFEYNIYGICVTEVEVDMLTGQQQILRVDLLEDVGQSISPCVDIGQVEGAFVMGLGYWLTEKLIYDDNTGACLTNRTWNYTPPGAKDIPIDFRVYFRRNAPNPSGVLRSKATGEPPLCLSVSAVLAIQNALISARHDANGKNEWFDLNVPYTPENILLSSSTSVNQFHL